MSAQGQEATASADVRVDDYGGIKVHTFRRRGRPCWLLFEIERARDEEADNFFSELFEAAPGEDFENLSVEDFARFRLHSGEPPDLWGRDPQPLTLLYEGGLAIVCGVCPLRKQLLQGVRRAERARAKVVLEERVRELIRQIEGEDRARKAAHLCRLIEHARRCGPLQRDDRGYAASMALVAELATGLAFPVEIPSDHGIAAALGASLAEVRDAMKAIAEDRAA